MKRTTCRYPDWYELASGLLKCALGGLAAISWGANGCRPSMGKATRILQDVTSFRMELQDVTSFSFFCLFEEEPWNAAERTPGLIAVEDPWCNLTLFLL